ncbi:hypothetical protein NP233_g10983 [Leucocoprinus birnbaumii]|uniref:Uncharacterized protein n=1 Tax=Leucocoprinus birnbaumii TaxID=56174 RepID=A0AAD5VL19_9AGAR|nr:hypothetical protein NP233_g10983 [Leucocoprinus birnbaumii]
MSQTRRKMLDLVNRLHSTGVQVDIDLPQIAVIGSQSAGKSSLIESISGITLPLTDKGLGCPTECRLAHSETAWKCTVSLRFTTDANGATLGQARNEVFGPPIHYKAEVEERIRRAQRAILNPSKPAKQFLEGDEDEPIGEAELSFSHNCVSLQISGPDVADLSFCDLPGLIASVGRGGNTNDIKLVESLVTSYIKKPSCIILLTVACETDFENQGAHQIAKAWDPEGRRTIGVLTKPDRIPLGEEPGWLKFIKNEKEPLENNWYCVKQPSSNDLKQNWTWQQAREKEKEFFSSTAPWCELEGMYQKYLRTSNLVERLSSVLSDLIAKRLPEIQDELEKSIHATREWLRKLPREPSSQPVNEVATLLHEFVADLTRQVTGVPDQKGLIQSIRPAQDRFRHEIRSTAPRFRPYEKRLASSRNMPRATFLDHEGGDVSDHDDDPAVATSSGRNKKRSSAVFVDEVFQRAQCSRTRELPGNYPFVVQQTFIDECVREWRSPAQVLCKSVYNTLSDYLKKMINRHFAHFGQGMLEHRIRILMQDHLKSCLARAEEKIHWLVDLEDKAFSLNTHYLTDYRSKFLAYYRGARNKSNHTSVMETINTYTPPSSPTLTSKNGSGLYGISKILSGLAEIGMSGIQAEDLAKLFKTDNMEPALEIMADVRAYFQVAYKRYTDNVPMAIDRELVCGIERDVLPLLWNGLGLNSLDAHRICKEFAQESSMIANRREELTKKLQRLEEASQQLLQVGSS